MTMTNSLDFADFPQSLIPPPPAPPPRFLTYLMYGCCDETQRTFYWNGRMSNWSKLRKRNNLVKSFFPEEKSPWVFLCSSFVFIDFFDFRSEKCRRLFESWVLRVTQVGRLKRNIVWQSQLNENWQGRLWRFE